MAISGLYENTATISTTEYSLPNNGTTLTPKTDDGIIQLFLDLSNLALGDQYELEIYEKARSADTQRLISVSTFDGSQSQPLYVSPSFVFLYGWDFTLKKLAGTDRAFYWSVRSVA